MPITTHNLGYWNTFVCNLQMVSKLAVIYHVIVTHKRDAQERGESYQ